MDNLLLLGADYPFREREKLTPRRTSAYAHLLGESIAQELIRECHAEIEAARANGTLNKLLAE